MDRDALVGRQQELQQLERLLSEGGASVLIAGEAGIGKSRLVAEWVRRARAAGRLVLAAACLPLGNQLPLLPIVDLLRDLNRHDGGATMAAVIDSSPPTVATDLARLVPELGLGDSGVAVTQPGGGWQQQRLFTGLVSFLELLHERTGVALVVEDLHWSDSATRDFLTYLIAHLAEAGPGLLMTIRSEETSDDLQWWISHLAGTPLTRLELPPLSTGEVAAFAEARTGTAVGPALAAELCTRTAGNAFFVEQLLAAGAYQPRMMPSEDLTRLLLARVAGLDSDSAALLRALAVAGRSLTEPELLVITGGENAAIRLRLRSLVAARLVSRDPGVGYMTRHALLAEVVVDDLLAGERAELHSRVAEVFAARDDPQLASETARHWSQAGRASEELQARIQVATYAETVYSFAEAAQEWELALRLASHLDANVAGSSALRAMVAWSLAGDEARGEAPGRAGIAVMANQSPTEVAITLRARLGMLDPDRSSGIEEVTAAVEQFAALPASPAEVEALARLYQMHRAHGTHRAGVRYLHRALERGRDLPGAASGVVQALAALSYEQVLAGDLAGAAASMAQARATPEDDPDPGLVMSLSVVDLNARLRLNDLDELILRGTHDLEQIRALGVGNTFSAGLITASIGEALLALGRVEEAARLIDPLTDDQVARLDTRAVHLMRCAIDVARGRLDDVEARVAPILALASRPGTAVSIQLTCLRAELELWRRRPTTVIGIILELLSRLNRSDEPWLAAMPLALGMRACADIATHARAHRDQTAADVAVTHQATLVKLASDLRSDPFAKHPFFVASAAVGALFRAEQLRAAAPAGEAPWSEAAERWAILQQRHRVAYARWRQAEALLVEGRRPEAATALTEAWRTANQHQPLRTVIDNLAHLARIDLSDQTVIPAHPQPEQRTPFGLTERELDVLRLLVDGLTNPQIGARLYIRPKTASVHVSAILRKLGATNRVHAATIAQRLGIGPTPVIEPPDN